MMFLIDFGNLELGFFFVPGFLVVGRGIKLGYEGKYI
jgi:hypothetical protein